MKHEFLHNHPIKENELKKLGCLDDDHVIVDKKDWAEASLMVVANVPNDICDTEKGDIIKDFTQLTARSTMILFKMLGLETHISATITNPQNGEEFEFSFKKVKKDEPLQNV